MTRTLPAILTLVAIAGALANAQAGIDFTPNAGERTLEGMKFRELVFYQDGHSITYEPPRDWTYTGSATSLKLTPPNVAQATSTIEQSPLAAPQVFDELTMKLLQQQVIAALPQGAQNAAVILEENNPVRINQRDTYAVTVSYLFYGEEYEMSVMFANLPDTQLRFKTVARKSDFEQVRRTFRASLFTLAWH